MSSSPRKRLQVPDLRALDVFARVAESGNMTTAARRLGLTQPAVSQIVRHLEASLDTELLDRQSRPLRLTQAGLVLERRARRLLAEAAQLRDAVSMARDATLPNIRLGLVDSFAVSIGADLIKGLERHAEEIRVWSGLSAQLAAGLLDKELDVLITADAMTEMSDLESQAVYREPFMLALPPELDWRPSRDSLTTLGERLPLVRYSARSITGQQVERYLRRARVDAPRRLEFDGSETVLAMVSAGIGWAITTPLCLLQGRTRMGELRLAPMPGYAPTRGLYLVNRRGEFPQRVSRIRSLTRTLLRRTVRTLFRERIPWAARAIRIG